MKYIGVDIPVRAWGYVDGYVDNSVSLDTEDGDIASIATGACVRDAGWRASAAYSGDRDEFGWPPQEHLLPVVLRSAHWQWVFEQLDRWEEDETDVSYAEVRELIHAALDAA